MRKLVTAEMTNGHFPHHAEGEENEIETGGFSVQEPSIILPNIDAMKEAMKKQMSVKTAEKKSEAM